MPGPGEYVSPNNGRWYAAQTPVIQRVLEEKEDESGNVKVFVRDVPLLDRNGKPVTRPNPAAVHSISKEFGDADSAPVVEYPESIKGREERDKIANLEKRLEALTAALEARAGEGRGPGRPRKAGKEEGQ